MSECRTIQSLSESKFGLLLDKLLNDQEFREAFFADPRDAIKGFGISLTKGEIARLMNLKWAKNNENMVAFNEKLVLCSSSGY